MTIPNVFNSQWGYNLWEWSPDKGILDPCHDVFGLGVHVNHSLFPVWGVNVHRPNCRWVRGTQRGDASATDRTARCAISWRRTRGTK